jgi:hypothetical protein
VTFQLVDTHDELPVLTEVVGDTDELPVLTEVIPPPAVEIQHVMRTDKPSPTLSGDEMVQLLLQLEVHLETVFARKLNNQLEHLQRLAVDLAVSEFKAELPQLLHNALIEIKKTDVSR